MLFLEESRHARVSSAVQSSHQNLVCLDEFERSRIARDQKRKQTASTSITIMTTHSLTRDGPRSSEEETAMLWSQSWAVRCPLFGFEVKFVKQRCGTFEVRMGCSLLAAFQKTNFKDFVDHRAIHHQFLYYPVAGRFSTHMHVGNPYGYSALTASSPIDGLRYVTDLLVYARRWGCNRQVLKRK